MREQIDIAAGQCHEDQLQSHKNQGQSILDVLRKPLARLCGSHCAVPPNAASLLSLSLNMELLCPCAFPRDHDFGSCSSDH